MDRYVDFLIGNESYDKKKKSKKKMKCSPKKRYKRRVELFRSRLSLLARKLNNIKSEDVDPILNNERFVRKSVYDYGKEPVSIHSEEWKAKFLTIYITETSQRIDEIVDNIVSDLEVDPEFIWEAKEAVLFKIYEDIMKLAKCMSRPRKYNNILLQSNLYTIYASPKGNHAKYTKEVKKVIDNIKRVAEVSDDEDILINDIFLLSYVLATGSFKFKDMLTFKEFEGKTSESNFHKILKSYGEILYKRYDKHDMPIMFWAYRSAFPKVYSDMKGANKNKYVNLSILVLSYTAWMIGDENVTNIIHNIITK